jgi:diketogulonate reductase-like aldo/keto reductase
MFAGRPADGRQTMAENGQMTEAREIPLVTLAGGVSMPMVGFGTWSLRAHTACEMVLLALQAGYRHVDTATMYANETEIGRALRDSGLPRQDVFLTTKLRASDAGRERKVLEASLRALGTDYVDLWLVHWPPRAAASAPVWRQFLALRDEGLARAAGVSNYSLRQIDELVAATGEAPAVNQIHWSPRRYDPGLLRGLRDRGVVVEGYSPLKDTNLRDPVLADIAAAHGVTSAQVVLRWHLEHQIVVIPKSANPGRMAANLDLFGFSLDPSQVARIDGLVAG